jgi:acetyltransferase
VLGLRDAEALRSAAESLLARVQPLRPTARIGGFTVQRFVERPLAEELIVGSSVDPVLRPVPAVRRRRHRGRGAGRPRDRAAAAETACWPAELIERHPRRAAAGRLRDHPPAAIDAISGHADRAVADVADIPELAELDINPLLADAGRRDRARCAGPPRAQTPARAPTPSRSGPTRPS